MSSKTLEKTAAHIPLMDLRAQYLSIKDQVDEAIQKVLDRCDFIQGEDVARLEREFAEYCGVGAAVGVASGTEALRLALLACGVGPGDEVITTPLTFIATAEAISQAGATPVFADVDARTCNLDPKCAAAVITPKTRAIIPVHLYGMPGDMDEFCAMASRHGIQVIEDAAQAHGARWHGQRAGSLGHVGCFSFYPGKNLGAYGDAGMVVTNDPAIAERVRLLRDHGRKAKYEHLLVGYNGRLDTIQAAVLRVKLRSLDAWNARRRALAALYRRLLQHLPLGLPHESPSVEPVYHQFVIRTPQRDGVAKALSAEGIMTGVHYPLPLHLQPAYRHLGLGRGSFPESERASGEVLSLPMFPELSEENVAWVAGTVERALTALAPTGAN